TLVRATTRHTRTPPASPPATGTPPTGTPPAVAPRDPDAGRARALFARVPRAAALAARIPSAEAFRAHVREPYLQLFAAQLTVAGTAVVANILIARALAPSGRGEIALLLQVAYLTSQVLLLGSERSFLAVYSPTLPKTAVRAYTRLLVVPCAAGLAVIAIAAVFAPGSLPPALVAGIALFTVVNVLVRAVRAVAVASGRNAGFLGSTIASQLLLLAALAVLTASGTKDPAVWLGAYVVAGAIPAAVCWLRWSRGPVQALYRPEVVRRRAVRREGLALLPSAIANMGMLRIDRLVIPALASTAALGIYATVATMTELLSWPIASFADTRLGAWRTADREGRLRIWPLLGAAAGYAAIAAPVLGVVIYLIVVPVFGAAYAPAKALIPPLIAASAVYGISRVSLAILVARRRNLLASAAEICGFAVSLVAYVSLIPAWGARGAAWGSLAGYAACLLFAQAALRRPEEAR
ncbi:MAG: NAD(P)H-quinone oxidoreductase chain 4, partial [Actinomycetia bacterium]|nr:NAD(P)H-quinone oxidoreductase chain 4 [Actinomycetes bacterium]